MLRRRLFLRRQLLALAPVFTLYFCASAWPAEAAEKPTRTVWDGVYASAQAERGQGFYEQSCLRCHGADLTRSGNVLLGAKFMNEWREDSLKSLFTILRDTMPRNAARSLSDDEYLDIITYLLKSNAFPAGSKELTLEALEGIQIIGKEGPQPVPNFALVTVVGCLTPATPDGWALRDASEPARTRNPEASTAAELADSMSKLPGSHAFGLMDFRNFASKAYAAHWMEAKGFLMRAPGNDRINLTELRSIGDTCKQR